MYVTSKELALLARMLLEEAAPTRKEARAFAKIMARLAAAEREQANDAEAEIVPSTRTFHHVIADAYEAIAKVFDHPDVGVP